MGMNKIKRFLLSIQQDYYIYDTGNPNLKLTFSYLVKVGEHICAVRRSRLESINPNFDESIADSFAGNADVAYARARYQAMRHTWEVPLEPEHPEELAGLEPLIEHHDNFPRPEIIDWKHYFTDKGWIEFNSIFGFIDGRLLLGWMDTFKVFSFILQGIMRAASTVTFLICI